jgi:DNA polymerase (family 10)
VADVDVVAASPRPAAVVERFLAFPLVAEVLARGEAKTTVRLAHGTQVDLRVTAPEDHASALHHLTGSKAHHVKLRGLARDRGYSLSEYGLARLDGGGRLRVASEEELYGLLGLPFIPPELREDEGEIEAARAGTLPTDLVRAEDVRGVVHCHTRWSDGRASVEEMALAADALGMEYLTVTDHSPSAHYAGGLTVDRLERQWDEIARVQERVRVRLLRGTEADITEEGALDFPDAVLERLDVVIASVHSRFKLDEDAMTARLVRAMRHPVFKIWGHARGRLLPDRAPFACRMEEVLDALAASRGAVEVNGDPHRLELEPPFLRMATARGIPVVLSVDAHSTAALGYLDHAVAVARRGWVRRGEVLNARTAAEFAAAVRPAGG